DSSLRIHACHTRLRELEVLRDALLHALSEIPGLKPSEIVVMAPNIQAYVPLLPAVFGEAGLHTGPLPYHIADVAVSRAHPLFNAFARLLDLPQSRLSAPEVIDFLSVPQIALRFGLSTGDVEAISGWLQNARVRWALDAPFRTRFDAPEIVEHTFAWGMDRMLAGYAMGDDADEAVQPLCLPDGSVIAPLADVAGTQAAALGALDSALVELARWCVLGERTQRASAWAARIENLFDDIFRIDPTDRDAVETRAMLLRFIRALASEPAESGLDPDLDFSVVRDLLLAQIAATPERQRFLMGGATFCGMVPQRAIPFRIVAVLGLNDGEFPRASSDGGIDLMMKHPRMGDRDVRSDDRYLFLQTVMSARVALHLSWIGEGVRDGKPRNPAAPLAELLAALDAAAGLCASDDDANADAPGSRKRRPWLVRHPLQPFDARYFDGSDPALFSYSEEFAEMDVGIVRDDDDASLLATVTQPSATPPHDTATIALHDVLAYFKDPARQFMTQRLKLRLDALDTDGLGDTETLEAKVEAIDNIARRLFMECIAQVEPALPTQPPAWLQLTGLLPPGRLGDMAWESESRKVSVLLDAIKAEPLFHDGPPQRMALTVPHAIGLYRLAGELRRAYETKAARWILDAFPGKEESALDFKQRIGLFIEWALLRLDDPDGEHAARLCLLCDGKKREFAEAINHWDMRFVDAARSEDKADAIAMIDDLRRRVIGLFDHWYAAQTNPQSYFPKTSWIAASKSADTLKTWQGSDGDYGGIGERDYAPGYARLLAGEAFLSNPRELELLEDNAKLLRDLITLPTPKDKDA
ncbi:MAG: exodeoxyribonuclease V subunit gamma, partial [Lysobacteraceae bacterium]